MLYPLLFALLGLQLDALEHQHAENPKQELVQLQSTQKVPTQRTDSSAQNLRVPCTADVRWHSALLPTRPWTIASAVRLELRSSVGTPDVCLPASIQLRVNYYDGEDTFVCGGDTVFPQSAGTQNRYFEFRPLNTERFFTWRDGPDETASNRRLVCYNPRAAEVRDPGSRSTHLKIFATLIPRAGGYAVSEATIPLDPPAATPQPVPSALPGVRERR